MSGSWTLCRAPCEALRPTAAKQRRRHKKPGLDQYLTFLVSGRFLLLLPVLVRLLQGQGTQHAHALLLS